MLFSGRQVHRSRTRCIGFVQGVPLQQEMMDLKQQMEETNESNKRNEEQMAILKQKQETTDSLLLRLISQSPIS